MLELLIPPVYSRLSNFGRPMVAAVTLGSCLLLGSALTAQTSVEREGEALTLEQIYSPDTDQRLELTPKMPSVSWLAGGRYLDRREESAGGYHSIDARTGKESVFLNDDRLNQALAALPGIDTDDAKKIATGSLPFTSDHSALLFNTANDLFLVDLEALSSSGDAAKTAAVRLTHDPAVEVGEEVSPDGGFVSFVRDYNLYLIDVASQQERQLTDGGSSELFFGRLDWVYQEEVYGRGNFKGYWWSPDSKHLTYLKLDESPVREFTVIDHLPTELDNEVTNYPKAGSPNPTVELGVVAALGGETVWLDTDRYKGFEHLIVSVSWTPDSKKIVFQVQDREQQWLDLNLAEPATGAVETLFREESPAFVNVTGEPHWLDDGSFLWLSERTGYKHIYHYQADGTLTAQLTGGEWEVETLHGVAEGDAAQVFFSSTEWKPTESHLYRVGLGGGERTRLSEKAGSHRIRFNKDLTYFFDSWSDARTPPQLTLNDSAGSTVRTLSGKQPEALAKVNWGSVEFLQVPTRDGFLMEAMVIKPPDFDPTKRYPVLQYNYGGPHAPVVKNRWGGSRYLWHQFLAQQGYVIWMCDNRSASGKGIKPTWEAYQQLGVVELADIEDGVGWLKKQTWVDGDRIGIWGWSYGGFMASYALTHSKSFKAAIAGAPVTDWRLYDSIYTERYMRRPQNNPEGYDGTSVVKAAANLHGKLFLIHGTMDDNVHFQNSVQFIYELQKAGKDFDMMIYPKSRHGVRDPELSYHLQKKMTEFVLENL